VDRSPFTKEFRNPGSVDGTPKVGTSSPVPHRKTPLPGTKRMTFPANEPMFGIEGVRPKPETPHGWTAVVFGILAVASSVALIGLFWVANWPSSWGGSYTLCSRNSVKLATFFLLGITPVFAIMSRIVSDGTCRLGCLAPAVLATGIFLSMVALSFLDE